MRRIHFLIVEGTGAASLLHAEGAPTHHIDGTYNITQPCKDSKKISQPTNATAVSNRSKSAFNSFNESVSKPSNVKATVGRSHKPISNV